LIVPNGVSLLPTLSGKSLPKRDLFFEHEGGRAVRRGSLKAVAMPGSDTWQLYDLNNDPAELHDLAGGRPDDLRTLKNAWIRWAETNGVLPLDSRDWGQRMTSAINGENR
jgi:arylsulfatase